jgi:hypothetical protein
VRGFLVWPVLIVLMAGAGATPAADVAATGNGQAILVREIDAPSGAKIAALREELVALAARTVDRLVDDRLRARAPSLKETLPPPPLLGVEFLRSEKHLTISSL